MLLTRSGRKLTPLHIAVIYFVSGVAWIVLSRQVLTSLHLTPLHFRQFDAVNHGLYVFISTLMIFFLIRRNEAEVMRPQESLRRLNRALKTYSDCNQALVRATDEQQLMDDVCRICVEAGEYRLAWVARAEHDHFRTVRPVASWGDTTGYLEKLEVSWGEIDRGRGPTGTAIRTGTPQVVQHILYDPRWELWRDEAIRHGFASSISLPLSTGDRPGGALVIFAKETRAFDDDEVKLLVELAQDLSYGIRSLRMKGERHIAERERKLLASVIEQAQEGILLVDSRGDILYVNAAASSITGQDLRRLTGHNLHLLQNEDPKREFFRTLWGAICRGTTRISHVVHEGVNGSPHEIEGTLWPITDGSGGVSHYAILIRDVTHELQLERQLRQAQRMEAIGTLAGGIAHDFNNNLASIITCTEMAQDEVADDSPVRELLDVVLKSANRGRNLVRQILTFSCQTEQERQPVQPELVVNECIRLLRASVPAAIRITQRVESSVGMVLADPTQIHQIVMNLCTNAIHAMRSRGGILDVSLENADLDTSAVSGAPDLPSGRYIRLMVRDTGHGMDRQTIERIFDPFFTTKGHVEGTGLGLSVVHGIVRNYGGAITVVSEPDQGSTFSVFLPRIDHAPGPAEKDTSRTAPGGSERILFVDDEEDLVIYGTKMLERLGYDVIACRDGTEALDAFRAEPERFDLIITDQNMPNMSGTELAREIYRLRADVPVILCSGYVQGPVSDEPGRNGWTDGIRERAMKPLDRNELADMIRRILQDGKGEQTEYGNYPDHR